MPDTLRTDDPDAAAAPAGAPRDHRPLATVLVVDDEPGMRHFPEKTLAPRVGQGMRSAATVEAADDLEVLN